MSSARLFLRWTAIALSVLGGALPVRAMPVEVGRASTTLPDEQHWELAPATARDTRIDQGSSGIYPTSRVLLRLPSPEGGTAAVLMLRGLKNSIPNGMLTMWGNSCEGVKPGEGVYVRSRATKFDDDCLVVVAPVDMARFLEQLEPDFAKTLAERGQAPKGLGYFIRTNYAAAGSQLGGYLLIHESFGGLTEGGVSTDDGSELDPAVLRWAELFAKELRGSALSWSGKFNVPRIELKREEPR